jgi:hypothetical protein
MSPLAWLQKKVSRHREETAAIRIKDYDGKLLQFTPFPLGHEGGKTEETRTYRAYRARICGMTRSKS